MQKKELYEVFGKKIALINDKLFNNKNVPTPEELKEIKEAVTFLHDHKYGFKEQGLNQIEFIILEAKEKIESLSSKE